MKPYFFVPLLMVFTGFISSPTATASPLETFDQDRLWVLLSMAGVKDSHHCARYYRGKDPVAGGGYIVGRIEEICASFTDRLAAYLALNGVSGVEPVHLQTPAFWNSVQARFNTIQDCQKQLGGSSQSVDFRDRIPRPDPLDYDTYEERRAADREHQKQRREQRKNHQRAWKACNPYLAALDALDIAVEECRKRLGGSRTHLPAHQIPPEPRRRDYATSQEYSAAFREYSEKRRKLGLEHQRAWRDCHPYAKRRLDKAQMRMDWLGIKPLP